MDVPVRFIDSIINNPLLMQFLVHRWFFLASTPARCCCGMNNLFISELFSAYVL